jgi:hypothetical protein
MMLHDNEVARTFLRVFSFLAFPPSQIRSRNMSGTTKLVVQTLLFLTKKTLIGLEVGN